MPFLGCEPGHGAIGFRRFETTLWFQKSEINYPSKRRQIPEEQRPQLHHCEKKNKNKKSKIGVCLRSCGCTDLEDASQETEILEIHGNVLEDYVHIDVLCLQLTVAFNFQLGQAFDVHVGQSDVKRAAGSTDPRSHGVIT